ncbi:MAG: TIR domain-containing protein, partial [Chloroflexi bacterium]|nr:TIR domain-containing protein [Chloroflexota bacterium]
MCIRDRIKDTIKQSKFFVCLIGPKTLDSEMVRQEIQWAEESGCMIISIWHGCEIGDDCPEVLRERQAIQVTGESAREYETAVNTLLNSLGYSTY